MYIKYRVKRTSGPVHEPIPAHPDSIYRPQHRPIPSNNSPLGTSRILANSPMVAAPLVAGANGLPLGWIIGPLIALVTAVALAGLIFAMKKKQNLDKKTQEEEDDDDNYLPQKKDIFNIKSRPNRNDEDLNNDDQQNPDKSSAENIPLKTMISNVKQRSNPSSSTDPDHSTTSLIKPDERFSRSNFSSLKTNSNPMLNSSLKQTRSMSNHRTESNLSENLQLTSIPRPISSSSKSNNDSLKNSSTHKLEEENNREWPLSSFHSKLTDSNISDKSHDNHQMVQSPELSSILTKNRPNNDKEKPPSDTNKTHSSSIINQNLPTSSHSDPILKSNHNLSNTFSQSQANSFLPNVPLCKTSTSSDDDDYDEIYPIHSNHQYD